MTERERLKQHLPVMQAWCDGKAIQFRAPESIEWIEYKGEYEPSWQRHTYQWRIKPEPREWWLCWCPKVPQHCPLSVSEQKPVGLCNACQLVKVREVIE